MTDYVQVSTATETREQAVELARTITEARLVASAQVIGPVTAIFWHLGEIGQSDEWQVILKTTYDRYDELEARLTENHPWSTPEIVAVPIMRGSEGYLGWISRTTTKGE